MLFYVFILTQVSFVCRISELSLADELLKHKAALSCIQSCSIDRPVWQSVYMHSAATECCLKKLRKSSVFHFIIVTSALSLPYHTNKNNFGLDRSV